MVAASTQDSTPLPHGTAAAVDRITASSPGVLIEAMDAIQETWGCEDRRADSVSRRGVSLGRHKVGRNKFAKFTSISLPTIYSETASEA